MSKQADSPSTTIVLTGGGSAGHVTPHLALLRLLRQNHWQIHYLGSKHGIERQLISEYAIPYYPIASGKLRRYFSWQNFIDPLRIAWGIVQSVRILNKIKPTVVFSKGGFVAFPVVMASWLLRIPVICHESDQTPGLATRLCIPFAKKVCLGFAEASRYIRQKQKIVVTGNPIRKRLLLGDAEKGKKFCNFTEDKPVILCFAGGSGSQIINKNLRAALPTLLKTFNIIHLCGREHINKTINVAGYRQFGYLNDELADVFAYTDLVISRAGANALSELLALHKPHILIPLSLKASRGDQIGNAQHFAKQGMSVVLLEEDLSAERLVITIQETVSQLPKLQQNLQQYAIPNAAETIINLLKQTVS